MQRAGASRYKAVTPPGLRKTSRQPDAEPVEEPGVSFAVPFDGAQGMELARHFKNIKSCPSS
ncbi:MAG: hypothetical protein ACM3U1_06825 [Chloroflexota bacterium]